MTNRRGFIGMLAAGIAGVFLPKSANAEPGRRMHELTELIFRYGPKETIVSRETFDWMYSEYAAMNPWAYPPTRTPGRIVAPLGTYVLEGTLEAERIVERQRAANAGWHYREIWRSEIKKPAGLSSLPAIGSPHPHFEEHVVGYYTPVYVNRNYPSHRHFVTEEPHV